MKKCTFSKTGLLSACLVLVIIMILSSCGKDNLKSPTITGIEEGYAYYFGDTISLTLDFSASEKSFEKAYLYLNEEHVATITKLTYHYDWESIDGELGVNKLTVVIYDGDTDFEVYDVNFSLFVNEMVFVEGGTFQMGCPGETYDCRNDALPYHSVTLDDFYISKYEVSVREFIEFLNAIEYNQHYIDPEYGNVMYYYTGAASIIERDGVYSHDNSNEDPSETPMSSVTWYGANAYCLWQGGRLPTEAEWEYAARGGKYSNGYHYAGSNVLDDVAMTEYISNRVNANPKGMKQPNELGLYDMSGNQSEYCSDYYNEDYYAVSPSINPTGPENSTSEIVTRGGCVGLNDFHFTVYERESQGLHYGYVSMGNGFRIVSNEKIF